MKTKVTGLIQRLRGLSVFKRGLLVFAAGFSLFFVGHASRTNLKSPTAPSAERQQTDNSISQFQFEPDSLVEGEKQKDTKFGTAFSAPAAPDDLRQGLTRSADAPLPFANPLIAHTAEIAVATKEFAKSRSALEEILERHRGYAAKLRMVGQRSGSVLNAMLRVPSTELGGTVSELKTLGDVEREEQAADEITQQHADLEARLSNARATLRRLQELLKKQTYADGNVRELQRQIGSANAEVNRLEGERQASEHRVTFANVRFCLREELSTPAETFGSQLHAAAVAGFGDAAASLSALLAFLIGRGPSVLLWIAILYVPARFVWKKWQPVATQPTAVQGD